MLLPLFRFGGHGRIALYSKTALITKHTDLHIPLRFFVRKAHGDRLKTSCAWRPSKSSYRESQRGRGYLFWSQQRRKKMDGSHENEEATLEMRTLADLRMWFWRETGPKSYKKHCFVNKSGKIGVREGASAFPLIRHDFGV